MSIANTHHHAHHFESAEHEYQTSKQGIWLFLLTEILMFGGLFVAYTIYKTIYPDVFIAGSKFMDWRLGALNTVILITSSLTMALGIYYIQVNKPSRAQWMLALTVSFGAMFMVIKGFEYYHKYEHGLLTANFFHYEGEIVKGVFNGKEIPRGEIYLGLYFCMTGLHGLHVLAGMGLITWVWFRTRRGDFNPEYFTAVEGVGLFWHLVDLIWIYLFPLFYLVT
jgi:cytochrome c oxidase subunit 3